MNSDPLKISPESLVSRHRWMRGLKSVLACCALIMVGAVIFVLITTGGGKQVVDAEIPWLRDQFMIAVSPVLNGTTEDGWGYTVEAAEASHSVVSTRYLYMQTIVANLVDESKNTVLIEAVKGVYDGDKNTLELNGPILFSDSQGVSGELGHAVIDLSAGVLVGTDQVAVNMAGQSLLANGVNIQGGGDKINFTGDVRVLYPVLSSSSSSTLVDK